MQGNFIRLALGAVIALGLQCAHAATVNGVAIADTAIADTLRATGLPDSPKRAKPSSSS